MISSFLLALALTGQAPRNEIADPPRSANADLVEKQRDRRNARYRAGQARVRAQAKVDADNLAAYQAEYKRMLPYLLEAQKQELQRMSDLERNRALHRMAAAAEQDVIDRRYREQVLQWRLQQLRR